MITVETSLALDLARRECRELWKWLPVGSFVRLDTTHAFRRQHALVVAKTREPIADAPLEEREAGAFEFCRLGILTSGGVACAYALRSHGCRLRVRPNHCVLSPRGETVQDPRLLFTDGTLDMVGDALSLVACIGQPNWIS